LVQRRIGKSLDRARFVEGAADGRLVTALLEGLARRQVPDGVVAQTGDDRVRCRRTPLDVQSDLAKHLAGQPDDCHIADADHHHLDAVRIVLLASHLQSKLRVVCVRQPVHLAPGRLSASLFEHPRGHDIPVLANLFGTPERVALGMGEESVIMCRDRESKVHVFLNSCRHRGMKVCRYDEGNTPVFTCPYHGWSYGTDGKLAGIPYFKDAYHGEIDRTQWGLVEVAQLCIYKGTVWATWDQTAPPFLEYLGDFKMFLDLSLDSWDGSEGGSEVIGGVQSRVGQVEQEPLRARAFLFVNHHVGVVLELRHIGFGQIPKDVDLAGSDERFTYLAAGDDANDDLVDFGLGRIIAVLGVLDQRDVVAGNPFFENERPGAEDLLGVVLPLGHVLDVPGRVLRKHVVEQGQVWSVEFGELDVDGVIVFALSGGAHAGGRELARHERRARQIGAGALIDVVAATVTMVKSLDRYGVMADAGSSATKIMVYR